MKPASPAPASAGRPGIARSRARRTIDFDRGARARQGMRRSQHRPRDEDDREPDLRADPIHQRAGRNLPDHHPEVEGHGDVAVLRVAPLELRCAAPRRSTDSTWRSSRLMVIDADSSPTIVHRVDDDRATSGSRGWRQRAGVRRSWRWEVSWVLLGRRHPAATSVHCRVLADCSSASSTCCVDQRVCEVRMEVGVARQADRGTRPASR